MLAALPVIALADFKQGDKVKLKRDVPLLLRAEEKRTAKAGEEFTVHIEREGKIFILSKDEKGGVIALNFPADAAEIVQLPIDQRPAYKEGYADGYLVGKTDAAEGRKRDGQKAMRLGKLHAKGRPDPEAFSTGYHHGYNQGWHQMKDRLDR